LLSEVKFRKQLDNELIHIHDFLMMEYGWIPLEEFNELPLPCVSNLIERVNERRVSQYKESEKEMSRWLRKR
jgi:hypothetical protein